MQNSLQCSCGQLSIELTGQPVSADNFGCSLDIAKYKQQQDRYSYFRNEDVKKTTGDASCISLRDNSGWQLNRYHCDECNFALFCVLTEENSLIGVATEGLSRPPVSVDVNIGAAAEL